MISISRKACLSAYHGFSEVLPIFSSINNSGPDKSSLEAGLQKPKDSGRLTKWAIELGEFEDKFFPKTTIKAQALANFVAEFTCPNTIARPQSNNPEPSIPIRLKEPWDKTSVWILTVDRAANANGCGVGLVLTSLLGEKIGYVLKFKFLTTNNEAEFEALIMGLMLANEYTVIQLDIYNDSQLTVN